MNKILLQEERTEILRRLDSLRLDTRLEFAQFLEHPSSESFDAFMESLNFFEEDGIAADRGLTKGVIIFDDLDWVVKFPLGVSPFSGRTVIDYCAKEYDVYTKALENGLGSLFAPMYFLECYFGVDTYVMEKVEVDPERIYSEHFDSWASISTVTEEQHRLNFFKIHSMAITLFDYHDESLIDKFICFCNNEGVSDLHNGNMGYNKDGDLVLIDYSGFYGRYLEGEIVTSEYSWMSIMETELLDDEELSF